jgi:leucyl aminopeptidase (aminopeptidase T)
MKTDTGRDNVNDRLAENSHLAVKTSCLARRGETVLIITDQNLMKYARAAATAAIDCGALPVVIDVDDFTSTTAYREGIVMKPLKAAIESSDIVICNRRLADDNFIGYGRLLGNPDLHDYALTAERRWMYLCCNGMEEWSITESEVASLRQRTFWLIDVLKRSRRIYITSPAGTDFSFSIARDSKALPILGLVPLYAEVAITPQRGSENGLFVVDGPTQQKVRPVGELDLPPIHIQVRDGSVKDILGGSEVQVERLKAFISSDEPPAVSIDEIGLLTTNIDDNDRYFWSDGTHHTKRLHIALGNNPSRDTLVHGPLHMDCEIIMPSVEIDGQVIMHDGIILDPRAT